MVDKKDLTALRKNEQLYSKFKTVVYFVNQTNSAEFEYSLKQTGTKFTRSTFPINAFYDFIREPTAGCEELIMAEGNFVLSEELVNRKTKSDEWVAFSTQVQMG